MSDAAFNPDNTALLDRFAEFFDTKQWHYDRAADKPVIPLGFNGVNARWQCAAIADPKAPNLVFMSLLPCLVPSLFASTKPRRRPCRCARNHRPTAAATPPKINRSFPATSIGDLTAFPLPQMPQRPSRLE